MTHQDISPITLREIKKTPKDITVQVNFHEKSHDINISLLMLASDRGINNIAGKITFELLESLRDELPDDDSYAPLIEQTEADVFEEMVDTICGRICSSLRSHGFEIAYDKTNVFIAKKTSIPVTDWNLAIPFKQVRKYFC